MMVKFWKVMYKAMVVVGMFTAIHIVWKLID